MFVATFSCDNVERVGRVTKGKEESDLRSGQSPKAVAVRKAHQFVTRNNKTNMKLF